MPPSDEPAPADNLAGVKVRQARRARIFRAMLDQDLSQAVFERELWADLRAEAETSADPLISVETLDALEASRRKRLLDNSHAAFFNTDDVILIPGFLGSRLVDASGDRGVVWVDHRMLRGKTDNLLDLALGPYRPGEPENDAAGLTIRPDGGVPLLFDGLKSELEERRYSFQVFGYDWRKDLEGAALALAGVIKDREDLRFRPLHLIAHSQGSLVARRAIQLLGADLAPRLVKSLILLGPMTAGSFLALTAMSGEFGMLQAIRRLGLRPPEGFDGTLRTFSGLYQMLPWRTKPVGHRPMAALMARPIAWQKEYAKFFDFEHKNDPTKLWPVEIDPVRLRAFFGWAGRIEAGFFNDRTAVILGDRPTVGGIERVGDRFVPNPKFETSGDGVVPDALALVAGVSRVYKAAGVAHDALPASSAVIAAVREILAGRPPMLADYEPAKPGDSDHPFPVLAKADQSWMIGPVAGDSHPTVIRDRSLSSRKAGEVAAPQFRRLRVFSFDPLMAIELDSLGTEQITLELPWEFADGNLIQPGPVGEYVEVIDCDPASGCVYPPIDLNHPHILAQDGIPVSEGDPRFHQQMTYAVAMNTILQFERALGRRALWSPHLSRDEHGNLIPHPEAMPFEQQAELEFVQRLRIYPHAMRQANAYYHPEKKALLFGYFPAEGQEGDRNLPGGMIFTCLSYDVVAHETTHALLDGMHRYFVQPSNGDVFGFHEAFADIVALFQHFSHRDVLLKELARSRGEVGRESSLGVLAAQFGLATGHRGALRQYLGRKDPATGRWSAIEPDPSAIRHVTEPHERGALLVAALFRAFSKIHENRVGDLRRIATGGTGQLPDGELHPDLVARMADEAAKSAEHMLTMCIRALDYVPPVDITFGEYLRALITADQDLIPEDARHYRASIVSAFRDWGIYPPDVRSLSVDNLLWAEPEIGAHPDLREFLDTIRVQDWDLSSDRRRAYERMKSNAKLFQDWLIASSTVTIAEVESLGLCFDQATAPLSIRRDSEGRPAFKVHSFRPCRRIGPDHQQRTDFVVEIVQKRRGYYDRDLQASVDSGKVPFSDRQPDFAFRGGCTLLIDPREGRIRYCVRKPIGDDDRLDQEREYRLGASGDGVGGIYIDGGGRCRNPFAFLHGGH